jgi:dipeptidyl aminopeptidase/acylaminoacyl peptidase
MDKNKLVAPYGSWMSPITAEMIASGTIRLEQVSLDGEDLYWVEMRPAEGGRYVVVKRSWDGKTIDVTPPPFNVRTRVHEYGGGSFFVKDGTAYFSNFADQRLYRQEPGEQPRLITTQGEWRYADGILDRQRNRIVCVCEDHSSEDEAANYLAGIEIENGERQVLAFGNDFYSSPRLSPDGRRLAWLSWNHPNMPWDGTELWVGEMREDGSVGGSERVAGGIDESVFQPEWSPDGVLHFISDRSGWWNLYRWHKDHVEPLTQMEAEFGRPQWVFGLSTYYFLSADRILCTYTQKGRGHLACLETATGKMEPIDIPYTEISYLRASPGRAVFVAGSPTEPTSAVQLYRYTQVTSPLPGP